MPREIAWVDTELTSVANTAAGRFKVERRRGYWLMWRGQPGDLPAIRSLDRGRAKELAEKMINQALDDLEAKQSESPDGSDATAHGDAVRK